MIALAVLLVFAGSACGPPRSSIPAVQPVTLRIGVGLSADSVRPEIGIRQIARQIALEGLVSIQRDGRVVPRLAESWSTSADGLTFRIRLRPSVTFHSGKPADAAAIKRILDVRLKDDLGPTFDDIIGIEAPTDRDLVFTLRRRSTLLPERLADVVIEEPGGKLSGTGPFLVTSADRQIEMRANRSYHSGNPAIDLVAINPYPSVRSAWAEMLRGRVDMLYEVGVDALDFVESSSQVKVTKFQRGYAYIAILNVRKPYLADPDVRRHLNAAIDRRAIVADVLRGHGTVADAAVWPRHWALSADVSRFRYQPQVLRDGAPLKLKGVFAEPSLERLGLTLQRQLQAIGVDLALELLPTEQFLARQQTGDFDILLSDYLQGPSLARPYWLWHSAGPFNFSGYKNERVDAALDQVRHASDDGEYQAGVAAFESAIVDDPPAIFMAWDERSWALSTGFEAQQSETAVIGKLQLWRPVTASIVAQRN